MTEHHPIGFAGLTQPPPLPCPKKRAISALWRVIEGDNDARQQHEDISTLLSTLEALPDD